MRLGIPQSLENKGKLRQLVDKQEFIPVCHSYLCPVIVFVLSENRNKEFSSYNHADYYIISLCIKGGVAAIPENKSLQ
jgi:hypothetical protein